MSQPAHGKLNNADSDRHSQGEFNSGDSSEQLFSKAEEGDMKMLERWDKDADWHIVLTGIMSATAAVLLAAETAQDLRPDSWATAAPCFSNVIQLLIDNRQNGRPPTSIPFPGPIDANPLPFTHSGHVLRGTTIWLLSLSINTLIALLATRRALRLFLLSDPMRRSLEK